MPTPSQQPSIPSFTVWTQAKPPSELKRENAWSRIHLVPAMLAEQDRDIYRRNVAALEREKQIMKDVPGWEVSSGALDSELTHSTGRKERLQHQALHPEHCRCYLDKEKVSDHAALINIGKIMRPKAAYRLPMRKAEKWRGLNLF